MNRIVVLLFLTIFCITAAAALVNAQISSTYATYRTQCQEYGIHSTQCGASSWCMNYPPVKKGCTLNCRRYFDRAACLADTDCESYYASDNASSAGCAPKCSNANSRDGCLGIGYASAGLDCVMYKGKCIRNCRWLRDKEACTKSNSLCSWHDKESYCKPISCLDLPDITLCSRVSGGVCSYYQDLGCVESCSYFTKDECSGRFYCEYSVHYNRCQRRCSSATLREACSGECVWVQGKCHTSCTMMRIREDPNFEEDDKKICQFNPLCSAYRPATASRFSCVVKNCYVNNNDRRACLSSDCEWYGTTDSSGECRLSCRSELQVSDDTSCTETITIAGKETRICVAEKDSDGKLRYCLSSECGNYSASFTLCSSRGCAWFKGKCLARCSRYSQYFGWYSTPPPGEKPLCQTEPPSDMCRDDALDGLSDSSRYTNCVPNCAGLETSDECALTGLQYCVWTMGKCRDRCTGSNKTTCDSMSHCVFVNETALGAMCMLKDCNGGSRQVSSTYEYAASGCLWFGGSVCAGVRLCEYSIDGACPAPCTRDSNFGDLCILPLSGILMMEKDCDPPFSVSPGAMAAAGIAGLLLIGGVGYLIFRYKKKKNGGGGNNNSSNSKEMSMLGKDGSSPLKPGEKKREWGKPVLDLNAIVAQHSSVYHPAPAAVAPPRPYQPASLNSTTMIDL